MMTVRCPASGTAKNQFAGAGAHKENNILSRQDSGRDTLSLGPLSDQDRCVLRQ